MKFIRFYKNLFFIFSIIFLSVNNFEASAEDVAAIELPALKIDQRSMTLSGLSSGAFMAIQMQVIHSNVFRGVGSFAGGVFGCADGNVFKATELCMKNPETINPTQYFEEAETLEQKKSISGLSNLKNIPVYLYAGTKDSIVRPEASIKAMEFFNKAGADTYLENRIPSEHGFPTVDQGNDCDFRGEPWVVKCQFDGAGEMFRKLYGRIQNPYFVKKETIEKNLWKFSQKQFKTLTNYFFDYGYIYVPTACQGGRENSFQRACKLHVAFHGCVQGPEYSEDFFARNAGYNAYAEANGIVILYPSVKTGAFNVRGCWDWFGYTGKKYLTRDGVQVKTIMQMISALAD